MAAVNVSLTMPQYVSDFGIGYRNVTFKIREGYQNVLNIYDTREVTVCGIGKLFKPRQLEATFGTPNGLDTILFPIPTRALVPQVIQSLLNAGALCINYLGERWTKVPNSIVPNAQFNPTASLVASTTGNRITGSASYTADSVTPVLIIGVQYEADPVAIANNIGQCIDDFQLGGFCNETSGISPRKLIFKARRAGAPGQFVIRTVPVSGPSLIQQCINALAPNFICVAYEGERYRNLQNIVLPD